MSNNPSISNGPGNKSNDNDSEDVATVKEPVKKDPRLEGLIFPLEIRKEVRIRRRVKQAVLPGYDVNEERQKVGSTMSESGGVITGLNREEEKRFLPSIINSSPSSSDWNKSVKSYYADLTVEVPPDEKDGRPGGYKMEVGLYYENPESYLKDLDARLDKDGVIINPAGEPINVVDYILWRYCLKYGEVANVEEEVNNSPKIRFYLYTKERETLVKKTALNKKREAQVLVHQNIGDREWVEHMLRNLIAHDKDTKVLLKDLPSMKADDKDILIDEYLEKDATKFITLGKDKYLAMRSFIEVCIERNLLVRIPNTHTILRNGETIGNTMEDTIAYLNNPKKENQNVLIELKAQLRSE